MLFPEIALLAFLSPEERLDLLLPVLALLLLDQDYL
jgi:hypothetical protein